MYTLRASEWELLLLFLTLSMASPCLRAASWLVLSTKFFGLGHVIQKRYQSIHSISALKQTLAHEWPRDWIMSVDLKYVYFLSQ